MIDLRLPSSASNLLCLWPQCLGLAILESAKVPQNFDFPSAPIWSHRDQIASACICTCRSRCCRALAPFSNGFSCSIQTMNCRCLEIII
uniref:Uncharacterized protein n=1 Tax=Arundo donax TaxID=35708 RepID=A0A0A9A8S7_ARUDO